MENGQKKMNLKVSDQARTIQFTYLTEPNEKWLANSNVLTNKSHKNSATISARGQNLTANATVELYENNPDITKSAEVIENDENGNAKVILWISRISVCIQQILPLLQLNVINYIMS